MTAIHLHGHTRPPSPHDPVTPGTVAAALAGYVVLSIKRFLKEHR